MESRNETKKALFGLELMQAGVLLTSQEMDIVFNAAEKLEGFTDEDFRNQSQALQQYIQASKRGLAAMTKRRQIVESLSFNLLMKNSTVDELSKREDLIEYVGKCKRIASMLADEFMEPDEKLEKVAEEGRRLIKNWIDEWKVFHKEDFEK